MTMNFGGRTPEIGHTKSPQSIITLEFANRAGRAKAAGWLHTLVRVVLSLAMIGFGMVKVVPTQFITFTLPGEMLISLGESSPSGMLWKFMATSTPYTIVTGVVELAGGLLLIFRRTTLVGALVCMVAMLQVSILNIAYGVPVLVAPILLLAMSLVVAAPWWRRLIDVLFLNRDSAAVPKPTADGRRIRLAGRTVHATAAVVLIAVMAVSGIRSYRDYTERLSPLDGVWAVDEFRGDSPRWVRLAIDDRPASRRLVLARDTGKPSTLALDVESGGSRLRAGDWTLRYDLANDNSLHLGGEVDGTAVEVRLHRLPLRSESRYFR
ncbi:hypothetical protein IU450_23595 [Nocardia abscessus]|uniref:DoxX family protein n=1 Tax=Nocardia abscessus TaxID=120957 RepID=UPI001894CD0B|nr:hypothetical protein [Nocardia abscessus]MBF6338855.1 hypothetical protein [Nocardia abscessus]